MMHGLDWMKDKLAEGTTAAGTAAQDTLSTTAITGLEQAIKTLDATVERIRGRKADYEIGIHLSLGPLTLEVKIPAHH